MDPLNAASLVIGNIVNTPGLLSIMLSDLQQMQDFRISVGAVQHSERITSVIYMAWRKQ